ncbi:uncharacterized protein E5676_scaffold78694G00020 [Cucumis melo var. makuwa]|uniref:Uncharacterized protein n=1 Tax=Cucumis melo var. makuwa TaxID=1194695 RepID=A0A5D3BGC0_CUCMM|nr:uncharacterized protein E6C27_scaffold43899G00020 [Cucumis melo var. makuwa]TYJ98124.1 uncharacterized protein E5676_scaffold78694G00020 [Cucumis melo var. makuwa]
MIDPINLNSNNKISKNDRYAANSTDSRTNSKASENNELDTTVLEDMGKQGSIDQVIVDREDKIDENEFVVEHNENSIHLALECLKWKAAVMEEMRALEKKQDLGSLQSQKGSQKDTTLTLPSREAPK